MKNFLLLKERIMIKKHLLEYLKIIKTIIEYCLSLMVDYVVKNANYLKKSNINNELNGINDLELSKTNKKRNKDDIKKR